MSAQTEFAYFRRIFKHYVRTALRAAGVRADNDVIAELDMACNALWVAMEEMIKSAIEEHKTEVKRG